ncbi:hypothetical protein KQE47_01115 [Raoultella planticola]|uniref:hypothetical protein n=1 Tax=Raoultella planticola TaxID=575 RepID=UPI00223AD982|nr:hypothetical protein [Raoultella planticola]MCS7489226.1 hypothetical protein [Raoultella planticola]MDC3906959.1 hypothetical protein [Raoultella planticola]
MTDITELAQRMKAAAVRAKAATEDYVAHRMSITVCLSECAEFNDLSDGPDNVLALVEALEKAQRVNNSAPTILRQLAEEKQKRGEVAAATAFNYAASALQKELSK